MSYVMCYLIMLRDQEKQDWEIPSTRRAYFRLDGDSYLKGSWEISSDAKDDRLSLRDTDGFWETDIGPGFSDGALYLYSWSRSRILHLRSVTRDLLSRTDVGFAWSGEGVHSQSGTSIFYRFYVPGA